MLCEGERQSDREQRTSRVLTAGEPGAGTPARLFSETVWRWVAASLALTPRQSEIARLMCEGHSYKAIAARAGISINTVRMHMRALFSKLGVHDRVSAILLFIAAERSLSGRARPGRGNP